MARVYRTTTIRRGLDYQDVWGLAFCFDLLNNPETHSTVMFETAPEEAGSGGYFLDDILVSYSDGTYGLYQVKHREQSTAPWTWEELLKTKKDGPSLLQKWSQSLARRELRDKIRVAALLTNGPVDPELERHLSNGMVDHSKLRAENATLWTTIVEQVGSEADAMSFFGLFTFRFGQDNLESLETGTRRKLLEVLNATQEGVLNLCDKIRQECRSRHTSPLSVETIREWCQFDNPRPLREDFPVPADFQYFDLAVHEELVAELKDPQGGVKVIVGKPGSGKSVYLSKLHRALTDADVFALRHHYHISPADTDPQDRLITERVLEALKAQFKNRPEYLGDLAHKNSRDIELREFISTVAANHHENGKAFVLIIDGLDHVVRKRDADELKAFLDAACFPQPGLWLLIGTQRSVSEHLPSIVLEKAPESTWLELPGLNRTAVNALVQQNLVGLQLPDDGQALDALFNAIYDLTKGNPLHLRYALRALSAQYGDRIVNDYIVGNLVPYDNDIGQYYQSLWGTLSDQAKTILFTLASVNFVFTRQQLIECVSLFEQEPSVLSSAFRSIQHLIKEDNRQRLSAFHNSFQIFLLDEPEFEVQKLVLKRRMRDWLDRSLYETLKWAELRKVKYELGDASALLEIDRTWLVEAICHPRNSYQVREQLRLATEAAFRSDDLAKAFSFSQLSAYHQSSADNSDEAYNLIVCESLKLSPGSIHDIEPEYMTDQALVTLMELAEQQGHSAISEEAHDVMIERQYDKSYDNVTGARITFRHALVEALAFDRQLEVQRLHAYIKQFTDHGLSAALFDVYARRSLQLGAFSQIRDLLDCDLTIDERIAVASQCARFDAIRRDRALEFSSDNRVPLAVLYGALRDGNVGVLPTLPAQDTLPIKLEDFDTEAVGSWRRLCFHNFLLALVLGVTGRESVVKDWLSGGSRTWSACALSALLEAALLIAHDIRENSHVNCEHLFASMGELEDLRWPENRDRYGLREGFISALGEVLAELLVIKRSVGDTRPIEEPTVGMILDTPFLKSHQLVDVLIQAGTPVLSSSAGKAFLNSRVEQLRAAVYDFPTRAAAYAKLASLARLHGDVVAAHQLLEVAASNLLGYGYHKDMYLHGVIDSIDHCARAGTSAERVNDWMSRLTAIVESVGDYTDGDETSSFRYDMANLRGKYDRPQLFLEYFAHAERQKLFRAQDVFKYVIRSLSFDNQEEIALGSTALDSSSLAELRRKAAQALGAAESLRQITDYLGKIPRKNEESSRENQLAQDDLDFAQTPPSRLQEKLRDASFENSFLRNEYLNGWAAYWATSDNKKEAYQALETIISLREIRYVSTGVLDAASVLGLEFDANRSFDLLCWAQALDYGWQMYWTDSSKAERRWSFLKDRFPLRYREFFTRSIEYSSRDERSPRYFVPISRGVEFLALFGDRDTAENITEAAVGFAESLMADMILPEPIWREPSYRNRKVDVLDLLIQRLLWPSPLVRERAASALASLFVESQEVVAKYLSWLAEQRMESVIAVGLLPIIRFAGQQPPDGKTIVGSVVNALQGSSIVIRELVSELCLALGEPTDDVRLPEYASIPEVPEDYLPDEFFRKYITGFLAPIYYMRAEQLEQRGCRDFIRTWAFVSNELIVEDNLERNQYVGRFQGDHDDDKLTGMSTTLSEAYRSAFLRVLQKCHADGHVADDFYLQYAFGTLPVDLSVWRILPNRAPGWWPTLSQESEGSTDLVKLGLQHPIEDVRDQGEYTMLAVEGTVRPAAGWESSNYMYSFALIGFAYTVYGPNLPTADQVAGVLLDGPAKAVLIPSSADRPMSFLENGPIIQGINDEPFRLGDLAVFPMIARVEDLTISLWQFFRDRPSFFMLTPPVRDGLLTEVGEHELKYLQNGMEVAQVSDFLEGLRERNDSALPIPRGQWMTVRKSFLGPFLQSQSLRLGYLLTTNYVRRPQVRQQVESFSQHKLVDVHALVLPK